MNFSKKQSSLSKIAVLSAVACAFPGVLFASEADSGHSDPFSFILIGLAFIIMMAMTGRWLANKYHQPPVLGELLIGIAIGNIGYVLGWPLFVLIMQLGDIGPLFTEVWHSGSSVIAAAKEIYTSTELRPGGIGAKLVETVTSDEGSRYVLMGFALWIFSSFGVVLLLFMVGLESSLGEMLAVGPRAILVAIAGVVCPFVFGYLISAWLLPNAAMPAHLFLAATLCATSVGITARVFQDLGVLESREAKIILGAAVIDDILGLVILAVITGIVKTGTIHPMEILRISFTALAFIAFIVFVGERLVRKSLKFFHALDSDNSKLIFPLILIFVISWIANQMQLAIIVGAFAAGLLITEDLFENHKSNFTLEQIISPMEKIFAPVFFVIMGMQVNIMTFMEPGTIVIAFGLSVVAILSKLVAGIPSGKGTNDLIVGIGMVPRGEVGLIFASIGRNLGVVTDAIFASLIFTIIITTLVTPPALKWAQAKGRFNYDEK